MQLNAETLHQIDNGLLGAEIDAQLIPVLKDISDRPGLTKPRKLVLELSFTPGGGNADFVCINFSVKSALPPTAGQGAVLAMTTQQDENGKSPVAVFKDKEPDMFAPPSNIRSLAQEAN